MTLYQKGIRAKSKDFPMVEMTPDSSYKIQIRNVQAFEQASKNLQKMSIDFPNLLKYTSSTTSIDFETSRGPPDEVFLYLERDADGQLWSEYQPIIKTVSFNVINQDIDSVTKLDDTHMFYATQRNSNFRSDARSRGPLLPLAPEPRLG